MSGFPSANDPAPTGHPDLGALGEPGPTLDPAEIELTPVTSPDDLTGLDRRNELGGIPDVPALPPVGLIDASTDASTRVAQVLIDPSVDVSLDTFVVSAQRLADGSPLFHYGIVTEVSGRVEGAETATDTARLARATLPGERYRRAEVSWLRTHPERYLPPSSGAPVWVAAGSHRRRALFLDKMDDAERLPIGLDMHGEVVFVPYSFLNGDRGAHVSISGKSGVATKTSYALFLLYLLFETRWGTTARQGNPNDRAVLFSVKGADLCLLDKHNRVFNAATETAAEARAQWQALGVDQPGPFQRFAVYAPAEDAGPGVTPVPDIAVRPRAEAHAYGWSPRSFIANGLLEYVFDDLESGQLSFIEQTVRIQLLRWAYPLAGDTQGRLVLVDPGFIGDTVGHTWEGALRSLSRKEPQPRTAGVVVEDLDELVDFINSKVADDTAAGFDPSWVAGVALGTRQAFARRLWKAVPRLRRLVRAGLVEVDLSEQISVVDVHALHADAQRFVVAAGPGPGVVPARELHRRRQDLRRARRAQQVRTPSAGLADQAPARRHRRPWSQPRRDPDRSPAEPVGRRPRHHQQRRARGGGADQVVGIGRARIPAARHAGASPDHRPRNHDHLPTTAARPGADPVPVPALRHAGLRGHGFADRRRRCRGAAGGHVSEPMPVVPPLDPGSARILHTSDWHLGVSVRNRSRALDHDTAIAEVLDIAVAARPDLILHTGDLFDGHRPPMADFGRAIVALRNLAEIAPVVVLAGNHDSSAALEVLATAVGDELADEIAQGGYDPLAPCRHRIRIHPRPATAAKGAVATYPSASGVEIRLAALPFVHANRVLKEFDQLAAANTTYADKLREIVDLLTRTALADFDPSSQVAVFASHVHVTEASLSSERTVHVSTDYATDAGHLPAAYGYLAFGHIHVPQPVAGGRGRYAGSILEVDFGEEGETKQVVVVDLAPGRPSRQHPVPLVRARRLRRVRAPLAELASLAPDLGLDIVEVTVTPDPDGNDQLDGIITLPGSDAAFDTLSAAVGFLLPDPEVVSVVDARRASVALADERPASGGATVSIHQSYRDWLGDGGRSLVDKTPGADPARVVELFDELLTAVANGDRGELAEDEALLAVQLQGSPGLAASDSPDAPTIGDATT